MAHEEKRARLQANRAALIQQHTTLTDQISQTTVGIHQIDGAIAVLNELDTDATAAGQPALNGAGASKG